MHSGGGLWLQATDQQEHLAEALRLEFGELVDLGFRLDLHLEPFGFTMSELDDLLIEQAVNEDESETTAFLPPLTREGDL